MVIGDRLRELREAKRLSQGDIEKRTGLLRCYISRVECGHTTPAIETVEKFARALGVPIYQIFYDGDEPPLAVENPHNRKADEHQFGNFGKSAGTLRKFRLCLGKITQRDRDILLKLAQSMTKRPPAQN
jgi:transcriptional regulator with XRE-family HTH domain